MLSKKQAEQSASEVCLRSLGDFPAVSKEKYTIQVYKGGQVHQQVKKRDGGSKYLSTLLQLIVGNLGLQFPQYRFMETVDGMYCEKLCDFAEDFWFFGSSQY